MIFLLGPLGLCIPAEAVFPLEEEFQLHIFYHQYQHQPQNIANGKQGLLRECWYLITDSDMQHLQEVGVYKSDTSILITRLFLRELYSKDE
jgi:hypothetical protein